MTENYNEVNTKYQPLVESEKLYKSESETLKIQKCEAEKKIAMIEEKYKGIEIQYDNLKQEFVNVKKDYNDSIQALEEINKSRNAYFAELQVKNEKLKVADNDRKEFEKIRYNEQALIQRLQDRVTELQDEYEKISRRETANSEMSAIQIATLETKYLETYKKFKHQEKLKNQWMQSYQREYKEHLASEVKNKEAEGNFKGQVSRNSELISQINDLKFSVADLQRQLEITKDEKID